MVTAVIDEVYTLDDFQKRFANAIDNNQPLLQRLRDDAIAKSVLTEYAGANSVNAYASSIRTALGEFTDAELRSLLTVFQSPEGALLKRLFVLDNAQVESAMAVHVNGFVGIADAAAARADSTDFYREFPYDLRGMLDGNYVENPLSEEALNVVRREPEQTETIGDEVYNYRVQWLGTGRYALIDVDQPAIPEDSAFQANIYAIEDDIYRYVGVSPSGNVLRNVLYRTTYGSFEEEVRLFRWGLNDKYLNPATSILPAEDLPRYQKNGGLPFFAPNPELRVTADYVPSAKPDTISMMTSAGHSVDYRNVGTASFELAGQSVTLDLLEGIDRTDLHSSKYLFLAFRDATSGQTTYGGGRYLSVRKPAGNTVVLDFNKAYHPYCAYAEGYACPVPPPQNTLPMAVEAGVRLLPQ